MRGWKRKDVCEEARVDGCDGDNEGWAIYVGHWRDWSDIGWAENVKMTMWIIASAYKHAVKRLGVGANWRFFLFVRFQSTR